MSDLHFRPGVTPDDLFPIATTRPGREHLVTGVTGFVGAALVLELLRKNPRDRALCVVRAGSAEHAQQRVEQALAAAAAAYEVSAEDLLSAQRRSIALCGDVTAPHLGLSPADLASLAGDPLTFWHCAASLKDSEKDLGEILLHNVTGLERLLECTLRLNIEVFNHVSTAYVSGRSAVAHEVLDRPRGFNNRYEQSKFYGECLVRDHCERAGIPYRILRPAIVVGHSVTGGATGYTGFLGWVLKVASLTRMGEALRGQPLRIVADPDARPNIVPIDSVVEDAIGIDAAGERTYNRVLHLTNQAAPTIRRLAQASARACGLVGIEFATGPDELDRVSRQVYRWSRFERPYMNVDKEFSRRDSARTYASPRHGNCPLTEPVLVRMMSRAIEDFAAQLAAGEATARKEGVA